MCLPVQVCLCGGGGTLHPHSTHSVKVGFFLFHLLRSGSESDQRLLRNLRLKLSDMGKPGPETKSIQRGDVTRMVEDQMSWVKR